MILNNLSQSHSCGACNLKVKFRSGAAIVNTKSLFSHDSKYILVASGIKIKVFNVASGECIQTLKYHRTPVVSLQENKANPLQIYSCSEDGTIVRWDYLDGTRLKVYRLEYPVVAVYMPTPQYTWYYLSKYSDVYSSLYMVEWQQKINGFGESFSIRKYVLPQENAISFGIECQFIASIFRNQLAIYNTSTESTRVHWAGSCQLLCVTSHPSKLIVATGDNRGRLLLWNNLLDCKAIYSVYHWHAQPLLDAVFTPEGNHLYSAGGESVLVKWWVKSSSPVVKIPRLGMPILWLVLSPDSSRILLAHQDNALQVLNSQGMSLQVVQGLARGRFQGMAGGQPAPTGMLYDRRTRALVMSGKPGHLQFYDLQTDKLLFNLDVVGTNYINESTLLSTDVYKAAFHDDWLATVQYRNDHQTSPEICLKFWHFDPQKQAFVLNTQVFLPHNKAINCIKFQPNCDYPLAVTTSDDGRFKFWTLIDNNEIGAQENWSCNFMGYYRELPAGEACFSEDGSLLAVAFEDVVTLWATENRDLVGQLCEEENSHSVEQLAFGRKSCCHLLVVQNSTAITVWNVLTLSVLWIIRCEVQYLVSDPESEMIAAFSRRQNVVIFRPCDPEPLYSIKEVSKDSILAALFVPKQEQKSGCWHHTSQLYFLTQKQELLSLSEETEDDAPTKIVENAPVTPFGMLQAEHSVSDVQPADPEQLVADAICDDWQNAGCLTLQDPIALCAALLPKLLRPKPIPMDTVETSTDSGLGLSLLSEEKTKPRTKDFIYKTDYSFLVDKIHFLSVD